MGGWAAVGGTGEDVVGALDGDEPRGVRVAARDVRVLLGARGRGGGGGWFRRGGEGRGGTVPENRRGRPFQLPRWNGRLEKVPILDREEAGKGDCVQPRASPTRGTPNR